MSVGTTFTVGIIQYIVTSNSSTSKTVSVYLNTSFSGEINIPKIVTYNLTIYTITAISNSAFLNNTNLTGISFPTTLKTIGNSSFDGCINLTSVNLSICTSLNSLGPGCFGFCSKLTSVLFPSSLLNIQSNAFLYCTKISQIDLSSCTLFTSLGEGCFGFCSKLISVLLPSSLKSIGLNSFLGCSLLENVDLSKCLSLTSLDQGCFDSCTSLKNIIIPASVTSIGQGSFYSCTSLKNVTFLGLTIPSLISDSFYIISKPSTAYYQAGVQNLNYLKSFNFFTYYIELPSPNPTPSPLPTPSKPFSYPVYFPYLQPTPSLGTSGRISGSISLGSRPKIGGCNRIYNYYHGLNQEDNFLNNVVFQIYGKKI